MTLPQASQIVNAPFLYINALQISNDATTPDTKLDVAIGQCRDSSNTYDMFLSAPVVINAANAGLNGLDTGSLAASRVYAVLLVSDPVSGNATGAMLSLSSTAPLMPFGYSAFRVIGYVVTDASVHFLKGFWAGSEDTRTFTYDAPQATSVTAGASTSYALIDLSALVPNVQNIPVMVQASLTPNAASDTLKLQPAGATGDAVTIVGQVAAVVTTQNVSVVARQSSSLPKIAYKVSAGTDAAAINVAGYSFFI